MGELGADAAEIVPDAGEYLLDLLRRLFREGGPQILAADAVLAQAAADELRRMAEEICRLVRIEHARGAQHRDRETAGYGVADRLEGVTELRLEAEKEAVHRGLTVETLMPVPASGSATHSARRNRTSWTSPR